MKSLKNTIYFLCVAIVIATGVFFHVYSVQAQEQEIVQDIEAIIKAEVVEVVSESEKIMPGTNISSTEQTLRAEILEGANKGEIVTVMNDYTPLKEGNTFFVRYIIRSDDGAELYSVYDPNRLPALLFFTLVFVLSVFAFGGWQGVRGLLSLAGSLFVILYVLLPGILNGVPPLLMSIGVSSIIIIIGSYITHGFNKTTTSAVIGMILTVVLTGLLAYFSVHITHLTGFESDEATYLNFSTNGNLDFVGLLLGGIMIGLLGVLYDVAIGQAISVEELHAVGPHIKKHVIYRRAIRIGREHIGALVNTLAIAYVGASLPLLLLFYASEAPTFLTLNREVFATEIIRTMIGSIGLVLAVPITTAIAVLMLVKNSHTEGDIDEEKEALEHVHGHRH